MTDDARDLLARVRAAQPVVLTPYGAWGSLGTSRTLTEYVVLSTEDRDALCAALEACQADSEWRRGQMENNWPRNQYGSLLTKGEYEACQAELAEARRLLELMTNDRDSWQRTANYRGEQGVVANVRASDAEHALAEARRERDALRGAFDRIDDECEQVEAAYRAKSKVEGDVWYAQAAAVCCVADRIAAPRCPHCGCKDERFSFQSMICAACGYDDLTARADGGT